MAAETRQPQPDDDLLPSGWGLHLVRRYTDEISYWREGGENVVSLIKRLTPTNPHDFPNQKRQ
jgi:anti-sigma regulatory factor (Ser/Thr protein kinase)